MDNMFFIHFSLNNPVYRYHVIVYDKPLYYNFFLHYLYIFRITYCGELFILMYILPTYSPSKPNTNRIIPPIIRNKIMRVVQPSGASGLVSLLIIAHMEKIIPITAHNIPIRDAILNGLTENAVKPFIQSDNSFETEYPDLPDVLSL